MSSNNNVINVLNVSARKFPKYSQTSFRGGRERGKEDEPYPWPFASPCFPKKVLVENSITIERLRTSAFSPILKIAGKR